MTKKNIIQKWKISKLHAHPRQSELFKDLNDFALTQLADDMVRNGQRVPIEITSDGTVIAGHQRVRAAKKLGWTEIEVIIRRDLEALGPCAILTRMIEDNYHRRHEGPLSVARCAKVLVDQREYSSEWQRRQDLLEEIKQRLNLSSDRNANRYIAALETPLAVQEALERGQLTLVFAGKVSGLPAEVQEQVATRITAGENPCTVVTELAEQDRKLRFNPRTQTFGPFVRSLKQLVNSIPESAAEIEGHLGRGTTVELLEEAVQKLGALKKRVKAKLRRDSLCESEDDRETKQWFDTLVARQNGDDQSAEETTTTPELPAKTRKPRAKKRTKRAG